MGLRGYLHRIPDKELSGLLAAPASIPRALMDGKYPECDVDKAWDAIDYLLQCLIVKNRIRPFWILSGGKTAGVQIDGSSVWYRSPSDVVVIAEILHGVSKEMFREPYDPEVMVRMGIYPDIWDRLEDAEDNFEYLWSWFGRLVEFCQEAAAAEEGMLIHVG